jgi:apolipoprotein N-acyltransferase
VHYFSSFIKFFYKVSSSRYALPVTGGALLGVGAVFFSVWILSLVSFAFLFGFLNKENEKKSLQFKKLFVFGLTTYGCTFFGLFWHTLPLDWLSVALPIAVPVVGSVWALTASLHSLVFAVCISFGNRMLQGGVRDGVLIGVLYVAAEMIGNFLFSILFIGDGSLVGSHFTAGSAGYQLADSFILLQFASVFGLYGLLFLQAFFGYLLYHFYSKGFLEKKKYVLVLCVVTFLICIPAHYFSPLLNGVLTTSSERILVGIATTYKKTDMRDTPHHQIHNELLQMPTETELIVLPEDSNFLQSATSGELFVLKNHFKSTLIVNSGSRETRRGLHPEIGGLQFPTLEYATSSKRFLMVFGEYMPYLYVAIGKMIGQDEVLEDLKNKHGYKTSPSKLLQTRTIPFSVGLCSDGLSPVLYTEDVRKGAAFLTNLSSHGWFHRSELMYELSIRIGKVRAVENRRWYVRAAHETPSFAIDSFGRMVVESTWNESEPLVTSIVPIYTKSIYARVYRYIPFMLFIFIGYCVVIYRFEKKRKSL